MTTEMEHKLLGCKSVPEFLAMFFGLSDGDKRSVFTEDVKIPKGTSFYRIRRAEGIKDSNDPKEWGPAPRSKTNQERFNSKGESIIYLASTPDALEREVRLKEGEAYYLAQYTCKESFKVGTFLEHNSRVNTLLHKIAMSVADESALTEKEKNLINRYFELVRKQSLEELALDMLASLYMYKLLPRIYEATNKLGKLVLKNNKCGIRYSSVYTPIELSGVYPVITFNGVDYGNYALTEMGYEKIEFISAERKRCGKLNGLEVLIKEFAEKDKMCGEMDI